jgi:hypothetical protein
MVSFLQVCQPTTYMPVSSPPCVWPTRPVTWDAGFVSVEVHVGFLVDKVTVREPYLRVLKTFSAPYPYFIYLPSTPRDFTN